MPPSAHHTTRQSTPRDDEAERPDLNHTYPSGLNHPTAKMRCRTRGARVRAKRPHPTQAPAAQSTCLPLVARQKTTHPVANQGLQTAEALECPPLARVADEPRTQNGHASEPSNPDDISKKLAPQRQCPRPTGRRSPRHPGQAATRPQPGHIPTPISPTGGYLCGPQPPAQRHRRRRPPLPR